MQQAENQNQGKPAGKTAGETEALLIKVAPRAIRGRQNKKLRKEQRIPAIVYGPGQKSLPLSLQLRDAEKLTEKASENKVFTFQSENKPLNGLRVIRKEISIHKVRRQPLHIDFLSLDMNKPIRIHVDIRFKGTPKGVKEEGGVFSAILRSVEIECLPDKIPPGFDLDVSGLEIGQNFHVSDLKAPDHVRLITKPERTLCAISEPEEEKPADAEAAPEAGAAEKAPAEEAAAKKDSSAAAKKDAPKKQPRS